jgi:hypothetical protein
MNDLPLFAYVPHNGTDTSRAAAESMAPHVSEIERNVLDFVIDAGPRGATCDEAETLLEYTHQTASARLRGLVLKGLIRDSGARRPTRSGRAARVYVAT